MNRNSINTGEIRKFGIIAFLFFGCLCALGIWTKKPVPTFLFGFLAICGIGFVLIPSRLKSVYSAWLRVAHLIGRIMTFLFLSLAYYLVITPSALIKRLFGGRPLPVKPEKKASSYWVIRTEPAQPRERFVKRF
jgi:Na+-transporting methylmalonyl-CoA/oxaloacetate decarboxylase gamma subunit